jgi:hypothetical protein
MQSAEQGRDAPVLSVFSGGWILRGQLTSYHWFLEYSRKHRLETLETSREYKKADKAERRQMVDRMEAVLTCMGPTGIPDLTALNPVYVTATSAAGGSTLIPALRVPVGSVTSWALVDFQVPKPPSGGGAGVAVGVAVPLG